MKKLVVMASVLTALAVNAQTNTVLSKNAVGYEKLDVSKGNLALVRLDFSPIGGGSYTVTNLIDTQLPNGSSVFIWDNAQQIYISEARTRSGWSPGTNKINRASAFFLSVPGTAASNTYSVYFMGEVPDATTAPSTTVQNIFGLGGLGYPYPVSVSWTGTTLGASAPNGSSLFVWDANITGYVSYARTRSGWGSATNLIIQPGQGFFFQPPVNTTSLWTEVKPYTWP
jgi:hypothetical protein